MATTPAPTRVHAAHSAAAEAVTAATATLPHQGQRSARRVTPAWACLVLAEARPRRERFAAAARDAGWDPLCCSSIGEAVQQHRRRLTQLALVDLGSMGAVQQAAYRSFASKLSASERLLVIADEPATDSTGNELWARQVGAWMYLASPEFDEGLTALLGQAREIAEKLAGPAPAST